MIYNVYAVFDRQIKRFAPVFQVKTETPDQVEEIAHLGYIKAPAEHRDPNVDLYIFGKFDSKTGKIELLESPVLVCSNAVFEAELKGEEDVLPTKTA